MPKSYFKNISKISSGQQVILDEIRQLKFSPQDQNLFQYLHYEDEEKGCFLINVKRMPNKGNLELHICGHNNVILYYQGK